MAIQKIINRLRGEFSILPFRIGSILKWAQVGWANTFLQYIPDRYNGSKSRYENKIGFYAKEDLVKWNNGNYINNAGDTSRFYFLNLCIDQLLVEGIKGSVVELGVYKGNSAYLLGKFARRIERELFLFDTFEGFSKADLVNVDSDKKDIYFKDTSLESVKRMVGESNVHFVKGYFPESLAKSPPIKEICLLHIDCDLEKPFTAALNYFYEKMVVGGFIVMHDYGSLGWEGATMAVDSFFKDKVEWVIPIPDKSGTVVVRKI